MAAEPMVRAPSPAVSAAAGVWAVAESETPAATSRLAVRMRRARRMEIGILPSYAP
jgi:hypothetical protein